MSAPVSANSRVSIEVENSCNWCCFRRTKPQPVLDPKQFTRVVHQPSSVHLVQSDDDVTFTTQQLQLAASTAGLDVVMIPEADKADAVFKEAKEAEGAK